jgi:hypothetical protein
LFQICKLFSSRADNQRMEGFTVLEIANLLGVPEGTVRVRLSRAGIKPITQSPLYDKSVVDAIRNVSKRGRPPKAKPEG